jgi:diacylglycerol O-acyltransferase / wax synthase
MYDLCYFLLWVTIPALFYVYVSFIAAVGVSALIWVLLNIFPRLFGLKPMSGRDSLFMLDVESNKLLVTSLSVLATRITLEECKSNMRKALTADPKIRQKIIRFMGRYYWKEDEMFDEKNHYLVYSKNINKQGLEEYVNSLLTKDLNPDHPPYEIHLLENYEKDQSVILFRFHHALADGLAMVSMTLWCADEGSCKIFYSPAQPGLLKKCAMYSLAIATFLIYIFLLFIQKKDKSKLHGVKLSGVKRMAWSNKIWITPLKQFCAAKNITFNDLLTAVVLESTQKYSGEDLGNITMTIPISLRGQPKDGSFLKLENDLTILPIVFPKVNKSLIDNCAKLYKRLKTSIQPFVVCLAMRAGANYLPEFIMKFLTFYIVNKATMLFSNVGGPKGPIFYSGHKYDNFISMSPNMARCGISVTSFSYIDHFVITCYADTAVMPDPKKFISTIESTLMTFTNTNKID